MKNITISYLSMRKAIGILALAAPFILILGSLMSGTPMQPSLSQYYWTSAGSVFVGLLVTFSIFLLSYNGYDNRDKAITSVAGVAMLLVAFFPCEGTVEPYYLFNFLSTAVTGAIHYGMAIVTFTFLGVMSFFQFTQSAGEMTKGKKRRNRVYRACGIVIGGAIIAMAFVRLIPGAFELTNSIRLFFWLESIVLFAFGASWLVKGEAILKD